MSAPKKLLIPGDAPPAVHSAAGERLIAGEDPEKIAADLQAQGIDAECVPVTHDEYRRRTGREPDWDELKTDAFSGYPVQCHIELPDDVPDAIRHAVTYRLTTGEDPEKIVVWLRAQGVTGRVADDSP